MTVQDVLAWLEERAKNSTSFGSHCHAYEVAARKLREALPAECCKGLAPVSECHCEQEIISADTQPRVIDFDDGEISVRLNDKELRGWNYKDDDERRIKMLCAREYVEGWCDWRKTR